MSPQSEFTVVICHGPYLSAASYSPLIDVLKSKGIVAYCPQLATNDSSKQNLGDVNNPEYDREPPEGGYPQPDDDVEIVLALLHDLIMDQERRVLLIAHSTGSFVAAQVAQHELQEKVRKSHGIAGGILGILHFGGFVVTVGQSITSYFQGGKMEWPPKTLPFFQYHVHGWAGMVTITDPMKYLFSGMDPVEAQKWTSTVTAFPMMMTKLTNDSYQLVPWGYVFLENEMTLAKEYQGSMVALQAEGAFPLAMYRCSAGYAAHLTCPERYAEIVQDFIGKIERAELACGDEDSGVEII